MPHVKTTHYGLQSIKYKAAEDWDEIQKELKNINFSDKYLLAPTYQKLNFQQQHYSNGN